MPGVNLSQSNAEDDRLQERSFFDAGIIISLSLLVLSGLAWGGVRFYLGSIDKKIAEVDAALSVNAESLSGEHIDRVADFDSRLGFFSSNKGDFSDPQDILRRVEGSMVPGVVLTGYTYNHKEKMSTIAGRSQDFKSIAEQILALKSDNFFSNVKAELIDRDDEGRIVFTLKADFK